MKTTIQDLEILSPGRLMFRDERGIKHVANFPLMLIRHAWGEGCDFEDIADGFGPGLGTMGGDWSGIRDSSDAATARMLERALNYLGIEH